MDKYKSRDIDDGNLLLIGEVIKNGIRAYGIGYIAYPCGAWWAKVGGINPSAVHDKWYRDSGVNIPKYEELHFCPVCGGIT